MLGKLSLTVCGMPMSRIAVFRPNFSDNQPKTSVNPIAPNAASEDIQDSSSFVILPDANGEFSDLNNSKLGPVKPMTMPNINAVKFTAIDKSKHLLIFNAITLVCFVLPTLIKCSHESLPIDNTLLDVIFRQQLVIYKHIWKRQFHSNTR